MEKQNDKIELKTLQPVRETMLNMGFSMERFQKEAGFVVQIWNDPKNSYLRKATKESLLNATMSIAQTGLTLNPVAKQAYLIPRSDKYSKVILAHLEPSYIGLLKLLTDAGQVKNIQTNIHYEGDKFDINLGLKTEITHKPYYVLGNKKGAIKGVYSVANLEDGNQQFEYMPYEDVIKIRDYSQSYIAFKEGKVKSSIWVDHESEMVRKTCLKRISKYLPRSEKYNYAEDLTNKDFEATGWQVNEIYKLISTCTLKDETIDKIERELYSLNYYRANDCIKYLRENQVDYIEAGTNYNMGDIKKKVKEKADDPRS